MLLLASCSGGSGATASRPPTAFLRVPGGAAAEGGMGSCCWAGGGERICRDTAGPVTAAEAIAVAPNAGIAISFASETPTSTTLGWFVAEGPIPPEKAGFRTWPAPLDGDSVEAGTRAPTLPGFYLLTLDARWSGKGDASYAWYIEERPCGR